MPLLCHFIVFIKSLFCAPSGHKNTLIIQYSESNSRVFYFLLEVPNLKIHRDMTLVSIIFDILRSHDYYTTGV